MYLGKGHNCYGVGARERILGLEPIEKQGSDAQFLYYMLICAI